MAAGKGNTDAQWQLGQIYLGYFCNDEQNAKEAAKWYRKAAEQGRAEAQYGLGELYANGNGVQQDNSQALTWFTKAANNGSQNAKQAIENLKEKNN